MVVLRGVYGAIKRNRNNLLAFPPPPPPPPHGIIFIPINHKVRHSEEQFTNQPHKHTHKHTRKWILLLNCQYFIDAIHCVMETARTDNRYEANNFVFDLVWKIDHSLNTQQHTHFTIQLTESKNKPKTLKIYQK